MKINQSLVIQQNITKVFEFLVDFSRSGLWSNLIITSEPLDGMESEPKLGYCYKNKVKLLNHQWEVTYQIIEFELNRLLTSKTTAGWLPGIASYCLEPAGPATRLVYQYE